MVHTGLTYSKYSLPALHHTLQNRPVHAALFNHLISAAHSYQLSTYCMVHTLWAIQCGKRREPWQQALPSSLYQLPFPILEDGRWASMTSLHPPPLLRKHSPLSSPLFSLPGGSGRLEWRPCHITIYSRPGSLPVLTLGNLLYPSWSSAVFTWSRLCH